ncbi:superoxide dismutase family protein [Paenibacillus thailandensis]|uniref:Superoxide dismutase [Cu-Zn] n=1 Tax=Paenibacillus thailandensis TaxID=393250 RepID=A0ABW5QZF1_9BACL
MKKLVMLACFGAAAWTLGGANITAAAESGEKTPSVSVNIINAKGETVGTAELTERQDGVHIHVAVENLPPGTHGIHFHETGKCDPPAFKTAGEHFNPTGKHHGFKNPQGFHAGDLPNLEIAPSGKANVEIVSSHVTLEKGKPNSLLKEGGTALVIHAKADDYATDPAGNSGDRIACGAIQ